jgi:hypothetical protein
MRTAVRASAPFFVFTVYYGICLGAYQLLATWLMPEFQHYLPVGGIEQTLSGESGSFEILETQPLVPSNVYPIQLAIACLVAVVLMAPVSWTYFITTPRKRVDQSFSQTIIILPIIVAGIAMIVQNSLPLAFSLAGIVAAVRFRFTLREPAHTLYIFCAITVGLGSGISAIGIATVISMVFVYGTLTLWALNYGARLKSPFFAFLGSRDSESDDDL